VPPPVAQPPAPAPPSVTGPQVRYPLDERLHDPALPPIDQSDAVLADAAGAALPNRRLLAEFFFLDDVARRLVVTVDNLPRETVAVRLRSVKPIPGQLRTRGSEQNLVLSPDNYRRYAPFVRLLDAIDPKTLVTVYTRFYPLFQQEYRNIGYPNRYFNDRVVEAIDDLLDAPEIHGPVRLAQPRVLYQFADPELEALSAGQKMMIRMGPENAARLKLKLQAIRQELTAGATQAGAGVPPGAPDAAARGTAADPASLGAAIVPAPAATNTAAAPQRAAGAAAATR